MSGVNLVANEEEDLLKKVNKELYLFSVYKKDSTHYSNLLFAFDPGNSLDNMLTLL